MTAFTAQDHRHMARALELAARGLYTTDPNPRVGCIIARDGEIVGEGWHQRAGEGHAEVIALAVAGERARGATVYVTLEPCCHHGRTPPCTRALLQAGVSRVIAAMVDPNPRVAGKGLQELEQSGVSVAHGLMRKEAEDLNPGFIKRMREARPYVRVKIAMSLDGRTALANGASKWITGEAARNDVHHMRSRSSAIVTGIGTVLADDPHMTARPDGELASRQPVRVVLDRQLRTPPHAALFRSSSPVWIFTTSASSRSALEEAGARVDEMPASAHGLDLHAVLAELAAREINEVMVEAGPTLSGAFVAADLADEIVIYSSPKLLGHAARGALTLPRFTALEQCPDLDIVDIRAVGRDWRITARPSRG